MAKRDYYEVLGLAKGAPSDEIKKAFRNRARQLHPDNKDSGDEAAFKELAEAYEVLSDEQKKASYDRYGHDGVRGSTRDFDNVDFSSFQGFGMEDIIDALFGGGMRGGGGFGGGSRSGPSQGAHLRYDLDLEFLEAVFGLEKKITVKRLEECTTCDGSGATPGSTTTTCNTCQGQGQVKQLVNMLFMQSYQIIACPECSGSGKKIEKPCRDCRGAGQTRKSRDFDVKVPAGVKDGDRLKLSQGGDRGPRGGGYGDLFVVLNVKDHPDFVRDGFTIHCKQPISFSMAALGAEILVPTVDGQKLLKVPAGTQSSSQLVMRDLGVPYLNSPTRRGDHVVHVVVETPTKMSNEEKKLLEQLAELRKENLKMTAPVAEPLAKNEGSESAASSSSAAQTVSQSAAQSASAGSASATQSASGQSSGKNKNKKKKDAKGAEPEAEDKGIFDKIVDVFRPKE
jgi:molecular chaperone DnaJ